MSFFYTNIIMKLIIKIVVLLSNHENHLQTTFSSKNIAYLLSFFWSQHFLYLHFHGRCKSVVFSFCLFPSLNVAFFVFYAKDQLQLLWCLVITKRCITLETAKELKTIISPSKTNCLMLQTFRMFSILIICLQRSYLAQDFYYAKINTTHFHSLSIKIKPFYTISHRTPFRTPILVFRIFFDFQFHIFFD